MSSTLDGTYTPTVGDTVWQQMYSPQKPRYDSTITERVAHGSLYGGRRLMDVVQVETNAWQGQDRWTLQAHDPKRRTGEYPYSTVEPDWCVLELVNPSDDGRLF